MYALVYLEFYRRTYDTCLKVSRSLSKYCI